MLGIILIIRLLASAWFAYHTPLWEKSDEINHYHYLHFIAQEKRLPGPDDYPDWPYSLFILSQLNQPPLYYLLLSPVTLALDSGSMTPVYANAVPVCSDLMPFKHYFIHTQAENFTWEGTFLAVWIGRGITMLMGIGATIFIWRAARLLWPGVPYLALLAAALFALMPSTVELTTWVNNDAPLLLFGAATLYGLVYCQKRLGKIRGWVFLLVSTGLCAATKLNGLAVLPVVFLFFLSRIVGRNPRRIALFTGLVIITAGGFVLYNQQQCGQVFCRLHRYTLAFNSTESFLQTLRSDYFIDGFRHILATAAAPWINDAYPPAAWMLATGLVVLSAGLLGAVGRFLTSWWDRRFLLMPVGLFISAVILAFLRVWWLQIGYMHVRYIAAAIPALVLLLAVGYYSLSRLFGVLMLVLPIAALLILTIFIPILNYAPVFVPPLRYERLPGEAITINGYQFESGVQIAGYSIHTADDGLTQLRLYAGTNRPLEEPLFLMVSTRNTQGNVIEKCGGTAGSAFWSTLDWQPGEWVSQDFVFPRLERADTFEVELYRLQNQYPIVNSYDANRPDQRTSGEYVTLITTEQPESGD